MILVKTEDMYTKVPRETERQMYQFEREKTGNQENILLSRVSRSPSGLINLEHKRELYQGEGRQQSGYFIYVPNSEKADRIVREIPAKSASFGRAYSTEIKREASFPYRQREIDPAHDDERDIGRDRFIASHVHMKSAEYERPEKSSEYELIRRKRELDLITREEEARRREEELSERISWLKYQEGRENERVSSEFEMRMRKREDELREKLMRLQEQEAEVTRREQAINATEYISPEAQERLENLEKMEAEMKRRAELLKLKLTNLETSAGQQKRNQDIVQEQLQDTSKLPVIKDGQIIGKEKKDKSHAKAGESSDQTSYGNKFSFPKFTAFSGEEPRPKTEASYEEWRFEVKCLIEEGEYSEHVIAQAIRKSLRGWAKRELASLGVSPSVEMMLNRLENAFGNVASGQSLLQEFYSTSQKQDEIAVAWGLRLEEILQKASEKGLVRAEDKDEMLRNKFWRSLRSDRLKNKTMVQFHKGLDFVSLRKAVREEEHEMKLATGIQQQVMNTPEIKNTEEMTAQLKKLLEEMETFKNDMKEMKEASKRGPRPFYGGYNRNRQRQDQGK